MEKIFPQKQKPSYTAPVQDHAQRTIEDMSQTMLRLATNPSILPHHSAQKMKQLLKNYPAAQVLEEISKYHNAPENASAILGSAIQQMDRMTQKKLFGVAENDMSDVAFERILEAYVTHSDTLYLDACQVRRLPESIRHLTHLETLDLKDNQLTQLPASLFQLSHLQTLDLFYNQLTHLPERIGDLSHLQTLDLRFNQLTHLPERIGQLSHLHTLDLSHNQLSRLPDSISHLTHLQTLDLSENQLTLLPDSIGRLCHLQSLQLAHNHLTYLPQHIGNLSNLQHFDVTSNALLPVEMQTIQHLFSGTRTRIFVSLPSQVREGLHVDNTQLASQVNALKALASEVGIQKQWAPSSLWKEFDTPENNAFKLFLDRIWQTKGGTENTTALLHTMMHIFEKMEAHPDYAQHCLCIAEASIATCDDRVAMGLVQMQLAQQGYLQQEPPLHDLYGAESTQAKADRLFRIVREKVQQMSGVIDEIETYLKYCKDLHRELGIEIHGMLYEGLSHVNDLEIEQARTELSQISEETIWQRLLQNPTVQQRYQTHFDAIQSQDRYDPLPKDGETDRAYAQRMHTIQQALQNEKIAFLKKQMKRNPVSL